MSKEHIIVDCSICMKYQTIESIARHIDTSLGYAYFKMLCRKHKDEVAITLGWKH